MSGTTADERNSRAIHTAACLIIGDEVLGGKACSRPVRASQGQQLIWGLYELDRRCKLLLAILV